MRCAWWVNTYLVRCVWGVLRLAWYCVAGCLVGCAVCQVGCAVCLVGCAVCLVGFAVSLVCSVVCQVVCAVCLVCVCVCVSCRECTRNEPRVHIACAVPVCHNRPRKRREGLTAKCPCARDRYVTASISCAGRAWRVRLSRERVLGVCLLRERVPSLCAWQFWRAHAQTARRGHPQFLAQARKQERLSVAPPTLTSLRGAEG